MARRRAIEADELFETANRLKPEGKEVTAVALLDALGAVACALSTNLWKPGSNPDRQR